MHRAFPVDADGNLLFGDGCLIDSRDMTVDSDGPFIATIGMQGHVVVASGGAVLVCPKDRAQDVKRVVEWLAARKRQELL